MSGIDHQKRPISPQELFERLLMGNFKEQQCEDQAAKVKEERQILLALIAQYRAEINKRIADQTQLQRLLQLRARLRVELEQTRLQRKTIDEKTADQIHRFKLTPVQIREQGQWNCQLEEIRAKNSKMAIRIKQLIDYCTKIQNYNLMLQRQGNVIKQEAKSQSISECIQVEDWRTKIEQMRREHENYSRQLRQRMKEKQERSLRQIMLQQTAIAQRNRHRISSFQERSRHKKFFY